MAPQIPTEVDLVALGHTAQAFQKRDRFVFSINNASAYFGFKPDMICAMDDLDRDVKDHPEYVDSIVHEGVPVLTTEFKAKWPNTVHYPLAKAIDWLGLQPELACKILSNTINYSITYLAMQGVKKLHLWGVEFTSPDIGGIVQRQKNFLDKRKWPWWTVYYMEALIRAPCEPGLDGCMWLLGMCHARGIEVHIPQGRIISSTLLDLDRPNFFYGYDRGKDPYFDG